MNVNEKIALLRTAMRSNGLEAYVIPSSDPHQSEYVADRWKSREWISGFTGSAGTVVVTLDSASLWTDSRYFIQAEMELADSEIKLCKLTNQFSPQYITALCETLGPQANVGIDAWLFSESQELQFKNLLNKSNLNLKSNIDLISEIWNNRPELPKAEVFIHENKFCGKSTLEKLAEIRQEMKDKGADLHLVTTLDDIAWIFNIRCSDVDFNPVTIAYAVIGLDEAYLFVDSVKINHSVRDVLAESKVNIKEYTDIENHLSQLDEHLKILIDKSSCNLALISSIRSKIINGRMPSRYLKAVKNETEINHLKQVMVKDAVAIAKTFYWLEQNIDSSSITEFQFAEKLASHRAQEEFYFGESFPAIIGYKGNGAIVHYRPMEDSSDVIHSHSILLCDSGGQYFDGTTDITRTITLGEPTAEQKDAFTRILKGHIALAEAEFPEGTTGGQLDILARHALWQNGMNYLHGTGHGVGFFLNVHEPPQGFAPGQNMRATTVLEPGMYSSNEPGFYEAGEFGMRIENLMITVRSENPGYLKHDTITLYPIDKKLIDKSLMSQNEMKWLNTYHQQVWEMLKDALPDHLKAWIQQQCEPIN